METQGLNPVGDDEADEPSFRETADHPSNWKNWSRATRRLLLALVLVAVVGFLRWALWVPAEPTSVIVERLRKHAQQTALSGDHGAAIEAFERLAEVSTLSADEQFLQAEHLTAVGDQARARTIMEVLAARPVPNDPRAHFWLACDLSQRKTLLKADWERLERHLTAVIEDDPNHLRARRMRVNLLSSLGRAKDVIPDLQTLAEQSDKDRLNLALALMTTGKADLATVEAQRVLKHARDELRREPRDAQLRHLVYRAALLSREFDLAEATLKMVVRYDGESLQTARALAHLDYLRAADQIQKAAESDTQVVDELIRSTRPDSGPQPGTSRLLEAAARDLRIVDLLIHSTRAADGPRESFSLLQDVAKVPSHPAAAAARGAMFVSLAEGREPGFLHELLGIQAYSSGRLDEAKLQWQAAESADPRRLRATNNLAYMLTWNEPPDLDAALALINRAIQRNPGNVECLETRGQVLARLGRPREAVRDLQTAVRFYPKNARLHATLGEVYRDLGLVDLASRHAEMAAKLSPDETFIPVLPVPADGG